VTGVPNPNPLALFAPPPAVDAEVFVRLPREFRVSGRESAWVDVQRHGRPTDSFIEGPVFDSEGNLFIVDIPYGRIFRISPQGKTELFTEYDGEPNGLAFHADGRLFVADYKKGLVTVDPRTRQAQVLLERDTMDHFKGLNDLTFASNGDLYFTDQGGTGWHDQSGRVYRLRAGGQLDLLLDRVPSPNGLALSLDEQTLFLAVTRANAVWRVPILSNGKAFKVGTFIQLSGGVGPDGLAIDEEGNIAIAHFGMGCAWLFSPHGCPLLCIRSPEGVGITNVCFGDDDRRSLYLTESESGCVLRTRVPE
jgi:gluconolactonase